LWRGELADRRVLVVLDDAEGTTQVARLLPAAPGSLTLITSRRRLSGLDGVRPGTIPLLTEAEGVALLTRIAGGRVGAEPVAAAEVVRRCGRLPLALRLAGARLAHRPTWRVADLVRRLAGPGGVLAELAVEDRTVAAAFARSYERLDPARQRVFRLLGRHAGARFTGAEVAALSGSAPGEADNVLDALVDDHLVVEAAPGSYELHDLIREFAAGLDEGGTA
jgi:hypothetical protein